MARAFDPGVTAFPTESAVRHNRAWPGYQRAPDFFDAAEGASTNDKFTVSPVQAPRLPPLPLRDNDG